MSRIVPDASVVAAAFFNERHSKAAGELLGSDHDLLAPDLLAAEFTNVVWKRRRAGEIETTEAKEMLDGFIGLPIALHNSAVLIGSALDLAIAFERTAYDCLYIALAVREDATFITADARLANALARTPLTDYIRKL